MRLVDLDTLDEQELKKELQRLRRQRKLEEQKIKDEMGAKRKALQKMVFDLKTSGMSVTEISKKTGKSREAVKRCLRTYLYEKSAECNETCINCKHLKLSDHLDMYGKPWDDVDRYCTKLECDVLRNCFCDNYEKLDQPRCLCEECVNYCGLYYLWGDDPNYIRCKLHGRWAAKSTCSYAQRKEE